MDMRWTSVRNTGYHDIPQGEWILLAERGGRVYEGRLRRDEHVPMVLQVENRAGKWEPGCLVTHWMPLPEAPRAKPDTDRIRDLEKYATELDERVSGLELGRLGVPETGGEAARREAAYEIMMEANLRSMVSSEGRGARAAFRDISEWIRGRFL